MATVIRTRTLVERCEVELDEGDQTLVAVGVAKGRDTWELVSDGYTYEVHDERAGRCTVTQQSGRVSSTVTTVSGGKEA